VLFGVLVGCVYPSWKIAFDKSQNWKMGWQFSPLAVWACERAYVVCGKVAGGRREYGNPRVALRVLGGVLAVLSLGAHLPILVSVFQSFDLARSPVL